MQPSEAFEKLKNWCVYQERSQFDVRNKLHQIKITQPFADEIIAGLIEENYLNEERFALAYAGGKFRIKGWGRQKIKAGLRKHQVSDYSIQKALASLNEEDYVLQLKKLLLKKLAVTKNTDERKTYFSLINYAVSKGYDSSQASIHVKQLIGEHNHES